MAYAAVHILRRIGLATSVVSMVSPDTSPTASDQHFRKPGSAFVFWWLEGLLAVGFAR